MVLSGASTSSSASDGGGAAHQHLHQQEPGKLGASASGLTNISQIDIGQWWIPEQRAAVMDQLDDLDERVRAVDKPRWRQFVALLSSATAFIAAMAWGRHLTQELDTDGIVDGKYNSDQPLPVDWALVPTALYLFGVMWLVFFVMHRMHRYRDGVDRDNKIWLEREGHWHSHAKKNAAYSKDAEDELASFQTEKRARQLHAQFLNQAVTNFTNSWTYTSMFMWTMLLHSFTVTLDYEGDLRTLFTCVQTKGCQSHHPCLTCRSLLKIEWCGVADVQMR